MNVNNTVETLEEELYETIEEDIHELNNPDVARVTIHENKVIAMQGVDGLHVDANELEDGIDLNIVLDDNVTIAKPVHMCFGVLPQVGRQRIKINTVIGKNAKVDIFAHCSFPVATDVEHIMDATYEIKEGAQYSYTERHVHSEEGGLVVVPKTRVKVGKNARFSTSFVLKKGRVGKIEIDIESQVDEGGVVEMNTTIDGRGDDFIKVTESALLEGANSLSVLTSKVACRDNARAEVFNKITATGDYARGHVDCKEVILGNGSASAIPIVDVKNPKAHVTHEAAVGSVDKKQLETLMARGLDEDDASELIIQGLLS